MWYWDYTPSWSNHKKKPLTKAALRKIQENYAKIDEITQKIKEAEDKEKNENLNIPTNFF